jgi:hypothetical protein
MGQNEWGEEVTMHTSLQAIDITCLSDVVVDNAADLSLYEDPFADLVLDPLAVRKQQGRRRTKRREAGDGQGPLLKLRKPQTCSVYNKPSHNKKSCKRLQILEGDTVGLGVD